MMPYNLGKKTLMLIRSLLGLTVLAAAAPVWAGEIETAAPIQAVVQEFGERTVQAYYTRGAGTCDAVLMTHRRSACSESG